MQNKCKICAFSLDIEHIQKSHHFFLARYFPLISLFPLVSFISQHREAADCICILFPTICDIFEEMPMYICTNDQIKYSKIENEKCSY